MPALADPIGTPRRFQRRGSFQPSTKSQRKSALANKHPYFLKKPASSLLASIPRARGGVGAAAARPRSSQDPVPVPVPAVGSGCCMTAALLGRREPRFTPLQRVAPGRGSGCCAGAAHYGFWVVPCPLSLLSGIKRPGEKTILSANYHNYSIMAILDEFLMKCALVSSGFHNFQVRPLHSSHSLEEDFSSPLRRGAAGAGEEDGPSRNFPCACQN